MEPDGSQRAGHEQQHAPEAAELHPRQRHCWLRGAGWDDVQHLPEERRCNHPRPLWQKWK
eukprot:9633426-Prorocentrum_lima.AAC.1